MFAACCFGAAPSKAHQEVLERGLQIWRKPGRIQNQVSCATCHSPDGIELAAYAFDDDDLRRRARPHLGNDDVERLVAYIHALRQKFGFKQLRDPGADRPLQPGGRILPGATAAERDEAFARELKTELPATFAARIETLEQAEEAEREWLALDVTNLPVGIPLNRLSEDVDHGPEHASIAQWLPEAPPAIKPDQAAAWLNEEDRYLRNPTDANLQRLLDLNLKLVDSSRDQGLSVLSALKFRALLVWQHRLRTHSERTPIRLSPEVAAFGNYNPIWEVGEQARQTLGDSPVGLGMDPATQAKKTAGPAITQQLRALRLGWFYAGWLSDQGLFKTSHDDKTRLGMWLSQILSEDGPYPAHNVFVNLRRQAVVSNDPESWGETAARRRRIWDLAGLRSFRYQLRDMPKPGPYRDLYLRLTLNGIRMNLLLLAEDIRRSGVVWIKVNTLAIARDLCDFIRQYDPASTAATNQLQSNLDRLVAAAKERF